MSGIEIHQFDSPILNRKRKIRVFLPNAHASSPSRRFKLLIQQDAQMAFTDRDADLPYGSWGIDEWIEKLATESTIDPPIVVAVDNSPARMREYFPLSEEFKLYERFVLEELLPWIHEHYRVLDGPENTALMGSSMGGLASFALALNHQDIFGAAACLSPWFEVENNQYVHDVMKNLQEKPSLRIYLDSGIRDWRDLDDGHRGM
ncbi:MAG: alpha/beta hydrolase-fold protein, partial [Candidatus Sumerlaeota bacterium]